MLYHLIKTQKVSNSCQLLPPCNGPKQKAEEEEALHNLLLTSFTAV